jgi:hypothetical protein
MKKSIIIFSVLLFIALSGYFLIHNYNFLQQGLNQNCSSIMESRNSGVFLFEYSILDLDGEKNSCFNEVNSVWMEQVWMYGSFFNIVKTDDIQICILFNGKYACHKYDIYPYEHWYKSYRLSTIHNLKLYYKPIKKDSIILNICEKHDRRTVVSRVMLVKK